MIISSQVYIAVKWEKETVIGPWGRARKSQRVGRAREEEECVAVPKGRYCYWTGAAGAGPALGPCLVSKKFCKIFQILRHIKSLDTCMKY